MIDWNPSGMERDGNPQEIDHGEKSFCQYSSLRHDAGENPQSPSPGQCDDGLLYTQVRSETLLRLLVCLTQFPLQIAPRG